MQVKNVPLYDRHTHSTLRENVPLQMSGNARLRETCPGHEIANEMN